MQHSSVRQSDLLTVFSQKPIDEEWSFADCKPSDTAKWTHAYHRYPAKFIPQLVEKLFDEYLHGPMASVNDPFMGSGTTVVSAISRGYYASGTDINRIAFLIAAVKARPLDPQHLEKKLGYFFDQLAILDQEKNYALSGRDVEPLVPERHLERIKYWFSEENIIKLGQIHRLISREEDHTIKNYLLVAFSNVLKNCSIWLKSSTKPTRDFKKKPEDPYVAIKRQLKKMQRGNAAFYAQVPEMVRRNPDAFLNLKIDDARQQRVPGDSVDLVVTSSPYVTSYEYADLHQLSTIWLDLANDLTEYKKEFIGTSFKKYEDRRLDSRIARDIVASMQEKNRKTAREIEAFFIDMQDVIGESYRILKKGGRACYVIGNTRLREVDVLNAEVFAETMLSCGFELDRIIKRQIPSKILPQTRDARTGKFAKTSDADNHAYPCEYIAIGKK